MSESKSNVPKLRFPGFTDPWEQRKLGEVASVNPPASLPDSFEYVDLESVVGTELVAHRTEERPTAPSRAQRLAQYGDVFFQTVRPYQKNNFLFELPDEDYVFSTGYAQLRPSCTARFLFPCLQRDAFVNKVLDRCSGTGYPAINAKDLAEIKIKLPESNNEQKKIGALFRDVDDLITLHQRELDDAKQLKRGLLQKMFPKDGADVPELRFPGFTDPWEQRKLGEVATISRGERFTADDYVLNAGIPCIHYGEIYTSYGTIADSTISQVRKELGSTLRYAEPGDIIMACTSENVEDVCKSVVWLGESPVAYHDDSAAISFDGDPIFLASFFQSHRFFAQKTAIAHGVKVMRVSLDALAGVYIPVPSLPEQRAIGALFRDVDDLITLHQRELDHVKLLKKALLQQMFV